MSLDPAYPGPYVDPNITFRNPPHVDITPDPPKHSNPQLVDVYDADGTQKSGFSHTAQPAASPNSWRTGRDPYKNSGMVGQTYFDNQG